MNAFGSERIYGPAIIMGITRKNILRNLFLNTSAYGVLRGNPCPVRIAPGSGSSANRVVTDDLEFAGFLLRASAETATQEVWSCEHPSGQTGRAIVAGKGE
jgi:hypothetical protein